MGKAPGAGRRLSMLGVVAGTKIAIAPNSQKKLVVVIFQYLFADLIGCATLTWSTPCRQERMYCLTMWCFDQFALSNFVPQVGVGLLRCVYQAGFEAQMLIPIESMGGTVPIFTYYIIYNKNINHSWIGRHAVIDSSKNGSVAGNSTFSSGRAVFFGVWEGITDVFRYALEN